MKNRQYKQTIVKSLLLCLIFSSVISASNYVNPSNIIVIKLLTGEQHKGKILYAEDSMLALWKSTEPYNQDNLNEMAVTFHYSKIKSIVIEKKNRVVPGMAAGALVGVFTGAVSGFISGDDRSGIIRFSAGEKAVMGGCALGGLGGLVGGLIASLTSVDDVFIINGNLNRYQTVLPALKRNAIFISKPPSAVSEFLESITEPVTHPELIQKAEEFPIIPLPTKFHISLTGALVITSANENIIRAFNQSGFGGVHHWWGFKTYYPIDNSKSFTWGISAEYNLTPHFRFGINWNKLPQQHIRGKDNENEFANGMSFSLFAEYVPVPINPLLVFRNEFAVGAGISYNILTLDGYLSFSSPSFTIKKNMVGIDLKGSYDFYLSRYCSLQLKVSGNLIPSIVVPSQTATNTTGTKTLIAHKVNFSSLSLLAGLRFHL